MPDLTSGSVTVTTPLGPSTNIVVPPQSTNVLTSPGHVGPPGAGVNLAGAVDTYADLPSTLGSSDTGKAYVVNADGKLYVWSGTSFPASGSGSAFRGDTGATGVGITGVTLVGTDTLRFAKTDASTVDVGPIPAIAAANASATAAAASASAASSSATAASGSASSATGSASAASGSAASAATQAGNAATSATSAGTSASTATTQASTATTQAGNAATSATAASGSATAAASSATSAAGSVTSAAGSASAAATSASGASSSASAASSSASAASTSATNAHTSEVNAAASEAAAAALVSAGIPNATSSVTGGIKLPGVISGELGGTYDHPAVVGWSSKADLVGGLIPSSQIPPVALVTPQVVTATADRTALTAQVGDVAIQTANPGRGTYMLSALPASTDGNWLLMVAPTDAVTSVQGYNGAVVLAKADLSLGSVDNTADTAKPVSTAQQTALNLKANNATTVSAGTGLTGGGDLSANRTLTVAYGTGAGTAAQGNDSRITGAVQSTRQVVSGTGLSGGGDLSADRTLAVSYGTTAGTAAQGNDSRITAAVANTRSVISGTGLTGGGDLSADRTLAVSYGTTAGTATQGNDTRVVNAIQHDANSNATVNNLQQGYSTTATAGGTTTLTVASTEIQLFTGSLAQTIVLPVVSTLVLGLDFVIANSSTGVLTVQSSGGNQITTIQPGARTTVICVLTTGTTAASWFAPTVNSIAARQIIAGTGLTGGGDLTADRTLTVAYGTTAGTATQGNDTRVVNAVQTTRQVVSGTGLTGGGDLTADRTLAVAYGTSSTTAAAGNDSRITGAVQTTRQVLAGTGLTGGGALSADQTLTVAYGSTSTTACVGNDARLSDARAPLAGTNPSDFLYVVTSPASARAVGAGDFTVGMRVGRAFTLTSCIYQFETADASGSTSAQINKNGTLVPSSGVTVTAANQADGTSTDAARTATPTATSFAVGDRISGSITAVGTTPGKGLKVYLLGTFN